MQHVFFLLVLFLPLSGLAQSNLGSCRKASTPTEQKKASHIYFSIPTGKALLTELRTLRRVTKASEKLRDKKGKLQKQIAGWYKIQLTACEKAAQALKNSNAKFRLALKELTQQNQKLTLANAKLSGQRFQFLVWGIVGGVVVGVGTTAALVLLSR